MIKPKHFLYGIRVKGDYRKFEFDTTGLTLATSVEDAKNNILRKFSKYEIVSVVVVPYD